MLMMADPFPSLIKADVMDHMDYVIDSLEMFGSMAENLITYTFNTVSYEMNTTVSVHFCREISVVQGLTFTPSFTVVP